MPAFVLLFSLPYILPWSSASLHGAQLGIHAQALVSVWLGSVTYHTFMNHNSGAHTYDILLRWDLVGVWASNAIGSLNFIYSGIYCLSPFKKWTVILAFLSINMMALKRVRWAMIVQCKVRRF